MKSGKRQLPGNVTLQNVANEAGVSVGSVSAVLSNRHVKRRISLITVEKVRAVAAKLGYLPNIGARRLRRVGGGDRPIVAFVTSYGSPFNVANQFMHTLRHAVADDEPGAFSLMIEMFSPGRLRDLPGLLTGDRFNAAIIANTTPEDDMYLARTHLTYPVIMVNRTIPSYTSVLEDPRAGALAAEVFVRGKKRSRLAVLHGDPLTQTTLIRVDSFVANSAALLGETAHVIAADELTELGAFKAMSRFLSTGKRIDALYAVTDRMALGAYHAIKRAKLRIPDDIAVIGAGDHEVSAFYDPPLSCVGVPRSRIGKEVNRLLMARLCNPGRKAEHILLPVQTNLRRSTGDKSEF
ncbi:MAG: LacI family DNA-binding transcriptional regulator [Opitutaceae bacterium]|nr:LacI family DNA-binding transcriptional regulator [Opitutaceae bacterium]